MDVNERFVSPPTYSLEKSHWNQLERDLAVTDLAVRKKPGENPLPLPAIEYKLADHPDRSPVSIHSLSWCSKLPNTLPVSTKRCFTSFTPPPPPPPPPAYTSSTAIAPTLRSFVNTILFSILICYNNLNAYVYISIANSYVPGFCQSHIVSHFTHNKNL